MHYVCVEDRIITSILNYRPNVPSTVKVHEISDEQEKQIKAGTHVFDIDSNKVIPQDQNVLNAKELEKQNGLKREKLTSTDWIVLRHIREAALGVPTSITQQEYLAIEEERQQIAKSIVNL